VPSQWDWFQKRVNIEVDNLGTDPLYLLMLLTYWHTFMVALWRCTTCQKTTASQGLAWAGSCWTHTSPLPHWFSFSWSFMARALLCLGPLHMPFSSAELEWITLLIWFVVFHRVST
jgi:hypothetical protein